MRTTQTLLNFYSDILARALATELRDAANMIEYGGRPPRDMHRTLSLIADLRLTETREVQMAMAHAAPTMRAHPHPDGNTPVCHEE